MSDAYEEEIARKLSRYGFLTGYIARDDAEEREVYELGIELKLLGRDPGWPLLPRLPDFAPGGKHHKPLS